MNAITHSQVQDLVTHLPSKKLPIAYQLLADLHSGDCNSRREDFMLLPLEERRKIMAEQASQMMKHYERKDSERSTWQSGEFLEYSTE
ncbi:MAG: hypothetical protein MAG431_00652 [Chloroflexi bacterium]|nr:hypothetical protein [Chloroflexota bacterium]